MMKQKTLLRKLPSLPFRTPTWLFATTPSLATSSVAPCTPRLSNSITLLRCLIRPPKFYNSLFIIIIRELPAPPAPPPQPAWTPCVKLHELCSSLIIYAFDVKVECSSSKKLHPVQFSRHIHTRPCLSNWLQIDNIVLERNKRGKYSQFQNNEYVQLLADKMMTQGMLTQLKQYGTPGQRSEGSLQKKALVDTELLGMLSTFMVREFNQWLHVYLPIWHKVHIIFMKAFHISF